MKDAPIFNKEELIRGIKIEQILIFSFIIIVTQVILIFTHYNIKIGQKLYSVYKEMKFGKKERIVECSRVIIERSELD